MTKLRAHARFGGKASKNEREREREGRGRLRARPSSASEQPPKGGGGAKAQKQRKIWAVVVVAETPSKASIAFHHSTGNDEDGDEHR